MTTRFTLDPPLASAGSWPSRPLPWRLAKLEATWRANMARRDAAAAEYGKPETTHEYAGRHGSQAEKVVCDCLRELRDIPESDSLYAKELMDAISKAYIETARESPIRMRRIAVLLKIGLGH